jgi:hypothetical protein
MEQTHELLNAIIILHIKSDTGGVLPPSVLNQIGKFTEYFICQKNLVLSDNCPLGLYTKSIALSRPSRAAAKSSNSFA